jgi:hypothetical protein
VLTIDGNDQGAVANGGGQFTGIYALNSDVVVDDVHVTRVASSPAWPRPATSATTPSSPTARPAPGEHTITVQNSLIDLFQKTGHLRPRPDPDRRHPRQRDRRCGSRRAGAERHPDRQLRRRGWHRRHRDRQ